MSLGTPGVLVQQVENHCSTQSTHMAVLLSALHTCHTLTPWKGGEMDRKSWHLRIPEHLCSDDTNDITKLISEILEISRTCRFLFLLLTFRCHDWVLVQPPKVCQKSAVNSHKGITNLPYPITALSNKWPPQAKSIHIHRLCSTS
jgi:hypothetical protein